MTIYSGLRQCCLRHWRDVKARLLAEWWGEVGQRHEGGIDFFHDFAVGFGGIANLFPLGIVLEGFPVSSGGVAAGVRDDVDERFAL
jgi:hypothetical protein